MFTKGSESCRCLGLGPVLIERNGVEEYSAGLMGTEIILCSADT